MKSDKIIKYNCSYKNQIWKCELKNVETINEIISFCISGRSTCYDIYLIQLKRSRWIDIPSMNISSPLSSLDDIFWNSEKIGHIMHSAVDGIMIAHGLKIIKENVV